MRGKVIKRYLHNAAIQVLIFTIFLSSMAYGAIPESNQKLITAVENLKDASSQKIDQDVNNIATMFWSTRYAERGIQGAYFFYQAPLTLIINTVNVVGEGISYFTDPLSYFNDFKKVQYWVSIFDRQKAMGEDLQFALDGYTYNTEVEMMLDAADNSACSLFCSTFDDTKYSAEIKKFLENSNGTMYLTIPLSTNELNSKSTQRRFVKYVRGASELKSEISNRASKLIEYLSSNPLPSNFPVDTVVANLDVIANDIKSARNTLKTFRYDTYLKNGDLYSEERNIGNVPSYWSAYAEALADLDNDLMQEQIQIITDSAKSSLKLTKIYLNGKTGSSKTVEQVVKASSFTISTAEKAYDLYTGYHPSNARDQIHSIPQEVLYNLPEEWSSLWTILDDNLNNIEQTINSSLILSSNLKITSPRPSPASYNIGETLTAEFTITNQGGQSITLDTLTVGGRLNGDNTCDNVNPKPNPYTPCADFTHKTDVPPIAPGTSYTYKGTLTVAQTGDYQFFPAYKIGNVWKTKDEIPKVGGVQNTLDLTVNEKPVAPTVPYDFATDATPKDMVAPQCQNKACTKTWRITNTGTTTWNTGYKLVYDGGYQMGGASVSIPSAVAPGGTKDITVNLTAPDASGTFNGYWKLQNSSGVKFGEKLSVQIVVPDAATNTVVTPKDDDLIQATGSPKVYLVKGGRKWWIKNETIFAAMGYNWLDVKKEYPASIVDAIPTGPTIVDNGSLIRVTGYPYVYLIQNGQKRWITDIPTFTGNGFKWEDVIEVRSAVGDMYPRGADITTPPRVLLVSPTGGESMTTGTTHSVLWSAVDDCDLCNTEIGYVESVDIYLSTNGGTSWTPIATGLSNSGSYQWTPTTASSSMKIKVVATDGSGVTGEAMSNAFSVNTVYTYADLTINSLSLSASTVDKGQQIPATTTVSNLGNGASGATNVKYYFSSTSTGKDVYLGQSSLPSLRANGSTTVTAGITIPSTTGLTGYIVAVVNPDNTISESTGGNNTSSASVIIKDSVAPTITHLFLPSYSFFRTGEKYSIVFEASDNIGVQSTGFYYSTDNVNWTTITSYFIPGSNGLSSGYEWTIPTTLSTPGSIYIKMIARDASGNSTERVGGPYTLKDGTAPGVTLLSPNGGEVWDLNSSHAITWNVNSPNGISKLRLYIYWGSSAEFIADVTNNSTGSYSWTVPNSTYFVTNGARIKIRLEDLNGNTNEDWSDSYFTIRDASIPIPAPWTTPAVITSGGATTPRIVADKNGGLHMLYSNGVYKKLTGTSWSSPVTIDGSGLASQSDIAVDSNGYPHIVYKKGIGGYSTITNYNQDDIYYSYYNGASWSAPENISSSITVSGEATASSAPSITIDPSNNVHIAWRDGYLWNSNYTITGASNLYYRKKDSSGNWSLISQLTTSGGAGETAIISDATGNLHLVYGFDSNKVAYIKWDGTSWSSPETVSTTSYGLIDVAVDKNSNPHAVWYYTDSTNGQQIQYSRYDGSSWSSPEIVSVIGSGLPLGSSIVIDSLNRPHVVYEETSGMDLIYRYKDSNGWSSPIQLNLSSQNVHDYSSDMTISSSDFIHVVWTSIYNGNSEVLYNYADVSGLDLSSPVVSVTVPSTGSTLSIGSTSNITWTATDNTGVSSITLEYSTDGGSSYTLIASGEANDGAYEWTVPNVVSNNVQIRITASDAEGNQGIGLSGTFSISDKTAPSITLTSPNGGESLTAGSQKVIQWTSNDNVGASSVDIYLSVDNGASWSSLASSLSNTGSYTWTVPSIPSSAARIKVVIKDNAGNMGQDQSDWNFAISSGNRAPNTPAVTAPANGLSNSSINTILSWTGGDPDTGDTVTYDVYFGTSSNPPLISSGQTETYFSPGTLAYSSVYYWRVDATDNHGNISVGPTWYFVTELPDVTPPITTASPTGGTYNITQSVTLTCNDGTGSGCDKIYYTTNGSTPTILSTVYTTPITILSTTTLKFFAKDLAENSETVKTETYTIDTTAPTGTISINSGAVYSTSTSVTLTLSCTDTSGCAEMQFNITGDSGEAGSTWMGYATTYELTLPATEGLYTVAVQFKDSAGNVSFPYSASITLDTTAPSTSASQAGGTYNSTKSVSLTCSDGTGSGCDKIYYSTDGSTPSTIYTGPITISETATIRFFAQDLAGNNEEVKTEAYTIDTVVPVLILSTLSDGSRTNNNTLNISGIVTDNTGVQVLTVNGNAVTVNTDGSFSYALILNEGANVITVVATDIAGNETTDTRTITLDTTAPALIISTPADNSKTAVSIATVAGTIDENSTVTVTLNGRTPQYASITGNTFTADIILASGINTIEATATDTAGNTSTQKRTVTYDNTKPSLEITEPNQDIKTNQGSVIVRGTASDALTTVLVSVTMNGNTYNPAISNGQFEQTVTLTTEKTYTITVTATDEAGNETTVQRNIIYDITQPIVDFTVTTPTNSASQTITGTMEEGSTITVTSATATIGTLSYPTATTWSVNISGMAEGNNTITLTAIDAAGNETTVEKQIQVDTIVPVTTATPVGGAYSSTQTVTLIASEAATIRYTVDGTIPTTSSPVYNAPLTLAGSTALSFFAMDAAGNAEGIKTLTYTINPVAAIDITPPSNVSNLTAISKDDGSISLTWTAPTDADLKGYNVYRDGAKLNTTLITINRYTDTNTVNGTSYTYKITSLDLAGNESGGVTGTATSTTLTNTPPSAPANVKVEDTGTGYSLKVVWSSNTESDLAGYKVYWGTASGTYTNSQNVGSVTSYTINGLMEGTKYYIAIMAYDTDGNESMKSIEATGTPKAYASRPDPATGLTLTPGNGYITLSWTGVSNVTGYMVYIGDANGVYGTPVRTTNTTYTFENLENNKTYYVAVSSYDLSTGSRYTVSSESEKTTSSSAPYDNEPPAVPSNLSATDTGTGGSVSLKWDRAESFDIAGYMIAYKEAGSSVFSGTASVDVKWNHTITGLTNGTTYTFNLYAYDSAGNMSEPSAANATPTNSGSTVDLIPPAAPILSAVPGNGKVTLIISPIGNDADHYNLYVYNLAAGKYMPLTSINGLSYEHSTGVENGKALVFVATAVDAAGNESGYSAPASVVPSELPGDIPLEEDPPVLDRVDGYDVNEIAKGFGADIGKGNYNPNADLDGNGAIDGSDLLILGTNHGKIK